MVRVSSYIMNMDILVAAITGLLAGLVAIWFFMRQRSEHHVRRVSALEQELAVEKERTDTGTRQIDKLNSRLEELQEERNAYQEQVAGGKVRIAELQTTLDNEQRAMREKLELLEQAEKKMTATFENLANRIIEEKSRKFTEQNKLNIGEVLNPLREQLGDFRKKIEDVYDKETRDRVSLHQEITSLKALNEKMSQDAINLTKALKGDSKKRGNWGEVILERVLEESGLMKGREYETQGSYRDENGKLFYPDVVVHLPNNKDVVIDSKVSLNAYERYFSAEEEEERQRALAEHLSSIRGHVTGLKGKNYAELLNINSLDMVLMFVPVEPALMIAFEHDETLFQDAFRNGIFLVSPSTLTMNLQIIHNMWRYEYQNQNAQEIARRAGDMYDKFVLFVEALEDVGDKLDKAQDSWQTAYKRLADGRGNLVKRAEDIRKLGLHTDKTLPNHLVNKTLEEEETPALGADDEIQDHQGQGHGKPN